MTVPVRILGFAGSLRRNSVNRGLLRAAAELLPPAASLETFDLLPVPLFNQDEEKPFPASVQEFRDRILAADALLIATPEYNHSIPGVLKNALDWASRPQNVFDGKPLAIMGAGGQFGTTRAQYHLRQVAAALNLMPVNVPQVLVFRSWEKFDPDGNLIDEESRKLVGDLLAALVRLTRQLRKER